MYPIRRLSLACVAGLLALATPAWALDVDLTVRESAGVLRTDEPVTTGVPIAKGAVNDLAKLRLINAAGQLLPAQFRKLASWPDGSVRVLLVDTQVTVPANGFVKLRLTDGGVPVAQQPAPQPPPKEEEPKVNIDIGGIGIKVGRGGKTEIDLGGKHEEPAPQPVPPPAIVGPKIKVTQQASLITVDTGPLQFAVDRWRFSLFQSLKVNGTELLAGPTSIRLIVKDDLVIATADKQARDVVVEEAGDLRTVIVARGRFGDVHSGLLTYTCRITAYAGKPYVKVAFWLQNDGRYGYVGAPEPFVFDGLTVELPLKNATTIKSENVTAAGSPFQLTQINESGQGRPDAFHYEVKVLGQTQAKGQRTDGRVTVSGGTVPANVAVRWFWQQYDKGIRFKDGVLNVDLWPTWGRWPRPRTPGSSATEAAVPANTGQYVLPGAVRKRHEMIFDFAARTQQATGAILDQPLMAMPSADYASDTMAFGTFAPGDYLPPDAAAADDVKRWNQWARNIASDDPKKMGIVGTRDNCGYGPFYGWMDFGDLFWQPGTCSLHYDWNWITLLDYIRLGDREFLDRSAEMAQHRIDVDQIWSDRVATFFRGLVRYEKGYANIHGGVKDGHYKPITSHNWIRGVVWWYYLTGDQSAYECAVRNAEGINLRQVNAHKDGGNLNDQTRSSGWAIGCLMDVYDMTADKKYLDWAMVLWNNHLKALWKEKGEPSFGMRGGNSLQFFYLAQPLVLLHQRTGDAELMSYIRASADWAANEDNWQNMSYHDDMASHLNNYYGYLAAIDKDPKQLAQARKMFDRAMTRDNSLKLYAGSGAYTKEVAKKLRNGHIWLWAERKLQGQ